MFRLTSSIALLACAMAISPLRAADTAVEAPKASKNDAKAKAKNAEGLQGYYKIIAGELKLTEDQKKQLEAAVKERSAELKKWDDANGAKLEELTAAEKKAKEANDKEAAKKAGDELKALKKTRTDVEDTLKPKFHALLNLEQKLHLQGYSLYVSAMQKFSKAELTEEQKATVKTLALEAGKGISLDVPAKELTAVRNTLYGKVDKDVLTQNQRDLLAKAAAEKAKPKEKKPAEKSTADKPAAAASGK